MTCPADVAVWLHEARSRLQSAQSSEGGWAYHASQAPATEPTALALLALSSGDSDADLASAINWLDARQRADGFFTASEEHLEPSWSTPLAGLAMLRHGESECARRAAEALLGEPVFTFSSLLSPGLYGFDTSLRGWPWTHGDFSFVEPTAAAMLFLKRGGYGAHERLHSATDLLRSRAIPGGGWNYGEPQVLGGTLFPAAVPTAMALAALADQQDGTTDEAIGWLVARQGRLSSLMSLGWAATALSLLGLLDDVGRAAVMARWCESPDVRRGTMETALCILALMPAADNPLSLGGEA